MWGGVGRSGSPTPRSMMSTPFFCCSAFISSIRAKRYGGRLSIRDAYIGTLVWVLYSIEFIFRRTRRSIYADLRPQGRTRESAPVWQKNYAYYPALQHSSLWWKPEAETRYRRSA